MQQVAPSESSAEDRKTRSLRAKSVGTNRTYIDLADKLDQFSRIDKDAKESRNRRIFELWLACWSNVDIAKELNCDEKTVRDVIGETADLPKLRKDQQASADHATDFDPPLYNIWKQQEKTRGSNPTRWGWPW